MQTATQAPTPPAAPRAPDVLDRVFCLHSFLAENADELSFQSGEWVDVLERDDEFGDGWWKGRSVPLKQGDGVREGLFPASYALPSGVDPTPFLEMQKAPNVAAVVGQETQPTTAPTTTISKSPSRPSSIRSRSRPSSPELEIPPVPTLLKPTESNQSVDHSEPLNTEKEQVTGLDLSIPPPTAEPDASPAQTQTQEPNYQAIHREETAAHVEPGEHDFGRRDDQTIGIAERAAEAAAHPEVAHTSSEQTQMIDPDSEDEHDHNTDQDATTTRTRLAEAARAENSRKEEGEQPPSTSTSASPLISTFATSAPGPGSTAHSRTGSIQFPTSGVRMTNGRTPGWGSGVPAGLIYSDESDSEGDEDDDPDFGRGLGLGLGRATATGTGTGRKTSGGSAGATKSPKMTRDELDRRVFGDEIDARGLVERVKGVAGGAVPSLRQPVSQQASPRQAETSRAVSLTQQAEPVVPAIVASPVEPLRVPGSFSMGSGTPPVQEREAVDAGVREEARVEEPQEAGVAQLHEHSREEHSREEHSREEHSREEHSHEEHSREEHSREEQLPIEGQSLAPPADIQPPTLSRTESTTPVPPLIAPKPTMGMSLSPPTHPEESPMGTPTPSVFAVGLPTLASGKTDGGRGMDEVDAGYAFPPIPVTSSASPAPAPVGHAPVVASPAHMPTPPLATMSRTPSPGAMRNGTSLDSPAQTGIVTPTPPATSALGQMSFTTPNQGHSPVENGTPNNGWAGVPGEPSAWSVDQVAAWAKSKGFDDMVCDKFVEHDITGDVLLEMDANTLKEIDIIQFGKRVKIANAINELRRPGSMRSVGIASTRSQQFSPGYSSHHRVPSLGGSGYPSSPNYAPEYQQPPQTQQHSRAASVSAVVDTIPEHEAYEPLQRQTDAAALGFNQQPTTSSTSSPVPPSADYAEWSTSRKSSASASQQEPRPYAPIREEDESSHPAIVTAFTPEPPSSTLASALSQPTTAVSGSTYRSSSIHSKTSSVPPTPTTPSTRRGSVENRPSSAFGHRKAKSSVDGNGTSGRAAGERVSNLLSGALSRNRKPAPRYPSSASTQNLDQIATDTGDRRSLSRFMGGHSKKDSKGSTPPTMTKASSTNPQRISVGTPMPSSPNNRTGPSATNETATALSKIGTPDFAGFLKKKGDRYNTWKTRYFVLKGARLYYLRNEREEKLKGHIDLAGYKVMTDANTNSGNYGFQLVHDREKPHHFSSNDHRAVKEWMKNLMKATITRDFSAPVISSCNIHTIPLSEAQALAPRPPSPTSMQATQRAARRDNPNQLTARDASVLMEFDKENGKHMSVLPTSAVDSRLSVSGLGYGAPPRPSREMRRPSALDKARSGSLASYYPDEDAPVIMAPPVPVPTIPEQYAVQSPAPKSVANPPVSQNGKEATLLQWINDNLPPNTERATSIPGSFVSGKLICRVIEHIAGPDSTTSSQIVTDAMFETTRGEPNLEGIFSAFDKCIDENVDINGISINDIRSGDAERITALLENLRAWGEQRKAQA